MSLALAHHTAHDSALLIAQWRKLAKKARLKETVLGEADGLPVIAYESAAATTGQPARYISTGVHGDEAAPPWAMLGWAEACIEELRGHSFILLPLMNPAGLKLNTRADHRGLDLNRRFHLPRDPLMRAWRRFLAGRPLLWGLCLHEDYDARGCYVYELSQARQPLAEPLMQAVEPVLHRDPGAKIEGRKAKLGIIRRSTIPEGIVGPEAIVLYQDLGCPFTLTFETPSEFGLDQRIAAQQCFLFSALEHLPSITE